MPKKPPKNSNWVQLTRDFVKEWQRFFCLDMFVNIYLHESNSQLSNNFWYNRRSS